MQKQSNKKDYKRKENMRTGTHKPKKVMTVSELKEYLIEQKVPDETIITESMSFVDGMELWTATDDGNNQLYLMMSEIEEDF